MGGIDLEGTVHCPGLIPGGGAAPRGAPTWRGQSVGASGTAPLCSPRRFSRHRHASRTRRPARPKVLGHGRWEEVGAHAWGGSLSHLFF